MTNLLIDRFLLYLELLLSHFIKVLTGVGSKEATIYRCSLNSSLAEVDSSSAAAQGAFILTVTKN